MKADPKQYDHNSRFYCLAIKMFEKGVHHKAEKYRVL
jgi:hypothetical protein